MPAAYSADIIFTGEEWLHQHAIMVQNGVVIDIVPTHFISPIFSVTHFANCILAPSFIDLQIYGANGRLLAVDPSVETLREMQSYCRKGGANYFMPTVATNKYEVFYKSIDAVKEYWDDGGQGVLGLHIEGPWISKIKRGAHIEELIHSPMLKDVQNLLEYGKGIIKMITLAPEVCSAEVIRLIQSYDIVVSAGHSNATYVEATKSFDDGIAVATHLFNAMSAMQTREPGMVGAIMHNDNVHASIIPDGHHVDFNVVTIAKKVMGDRLFMITDAVTETSEGYYPHEKDGDKYISGGILSGSALTMALGVKNCVEQAGIELDEALRMASLYPARVLGLQNKLGRILKGSQADFVILDGDLQPVEFV